jgi:hypothetical protein
MPALKYFLTVFSNGPVIQTAGERRSKVCTWHSGGR